jgi:6-phosphofructokinase 1
MEKEFNAEVETLGPCNYDSPLTIPQFIDDSRRVRRQVEMGIPTEKSISADGSEDSFEQAGPRRRIYFDPSVIRVAIVTCGGLCPGLNNVIQSIVRMLWHGYGVRKIWGVPFGYEGLNPDFGHRWSTLNPEIVDTIHTIGGTILGSSRGNQDVRTMVDSLVEWNISILFTLGGDGTLAGAGAIQEEIKRRGLRIAVAGIPKTIDNDIVHVDRTFGFETAVAEATEAVKAAHVEAKGSRNGIGLVKVMGRDSGFIAAYATLASNEANYCFVPEIRFAIDGPNGFLTHLEKRLDRKKHAVILVAEGAGQEFFRGQREKDASGNLLNQDIGTYLRDEIRQHFKRQNIHLNLKYIDPSYIIRSVIASASDAVFCIMLAQNVVHAAMAGKTGFLVGRCNQVFTTIPLRLVTGRRKRIDPLGHLWTIVQSATGQPDFI